MKRAPIDLKLKTRRWVNYCLKCWQLDEHHQKLLILAGQAWDRCQQARDAIENDGLMIDDRYKMKKLHPAVAVERDSRLAFARLLRELNLSGDTGPDSPRPPELKY